MTLKGTLFITLVICILLFDSMCWAWERKRAPENKLYKRARVSFFNEPWSIRRDKRYHYMHMSDAGYGSRLFVSSWLGRALIAQKKIFGIYGPGKKK